jgi:hypothetical protein
MEYLGWAFWVLNAVVSIFAIWFWLTSIWGIRRPYHVWLWIWQAVGVGLVPLLGWSPWHLAWWFPAGFVVYVTLMRLLYLAGIIRF